MSEINLRVTLNDGTQCDAYKRATTNGGNENHAPIYLLERSARRRGIRKDIIDGTDVWLLPDGTVDDFEGFSLTEATAARYVLGDEPLPVEEATRLALAVSEPSYRAA